MKSYRESELLQEIKALQATLSSQQALLNAIPDIVMEVDVDKVYTWANQTGYGFFGEDVIGKEASHYFEGEQDTYEKVASLFKGEESVIYLESWQRRKDGQKRLLAWWCRVIKDVGGNVTGAISTARDITERNRTDEELRKRAEKLERTNDELEHFNLLSVGREHRMIELKREVNQLAEALGREIPYDLSFIESQGAKS